VLELEITKPAKAGTMESNDIYIMVQPGGNRGVELQLESIVIKQFGKQIEKVILDTVKELGIENIIIVAKDRGALDYTIRARVETAIKRAI
jgi:citrate lyase subunit gamma (acyl carrier protein)